MSDRLYSTVLRWSNGHGIAKMYGVSVPLTSPPVLGGAQVAFVEYIPEINQMDIRPLAGAPVRRMEQLEILEADRLLRNLTKEGLPDDEPFDGRGPGDGLGRAEWLY